MLFFLGAVTPSKQIRPANTNTPILLIIKRKQQECQKTASKLFSTEWFLISQKGLFLLSIQAQMSVLPYFSTLMTYFTSSHSLSLSFLHLCGHHEGKEKWSVGLIEALDTLSWFCRKAPFISSYWIFVCVVSVLFNFTQQFVFITGQQRVSEHPKTMPC